MTDERRGIMTKMDAVERLRFISRAYKKINNYGFYDKEGNEVNLCGAIAYGNYVYATNNHFIGRIKVPDGKPAPVARYWDYTEEIEDDRAKPNSPLDEPAGARKVSEQQQPLFYNYLTDKWEENLPYQDFARLYIKHFNRYILSWRENLIKLKKNSVLEALKDIFGRNENKRASYIVLIQARPDDRVTYFRVMHKSKKNPDDEYEFTLPMYIHPNRSPYDNYEPPAICSVNCYYFTHILNVFEEYDVIDLTFDNNSFKNPFNEKGTNEKPVLLKGVNPRVDWKPDIRFALGQAKPKYAYLEKDLY